MLRLIVATCAALMIAGTVDTAHAHVNPVDVAQRCAARVQHIVDRCENAAADETSECIRKIRRLLADGQRDRAVQVARDCIQAARQRTRNCTAEVRDVCGECIDYLLSVGAERLAARVRNLCSDAIEDLQNLLERQENAVQQALNG
jgi:predicted component of type VI protein secretion system